MIENCIRNHWSVVNGKIWGDFCEHCGENIARFRGMEFLGEEYKKEDQRAIAARSRPDAICGCIVWPCGLQGPGCQEKCPFKEKD